MTTYVNHLLDVIRLGAWLVPVRELHCSAIRLRSRVISVSETTESNGSAQSFHMSM